MGLPFVFSHLKLEESTKLKQWNDGILIRYLMCLRCSGSSGGSGGPGQSSHSFNISALFPESLLLQRIGNSLFETVGVEEPFVDLLCLFLAAGCDLI